MNKFYGKAGNAELLCRRPQKRKPGSKPFRLYISQRISYTLNPQTGSRQSTLFTKNIAVLLHYFLIVLQE
jgi:hypothetical protein